MKIIVKRKFYTLILLTGILFWGGNISAQLSLIENLSKPSIAKDTSKANQVISIDNLNREIEFTDNLIARIDISQIADNQESHLIAEIDSFSKFIVDQGNEFKQIESEKLPHFLLISFKRGWIEYSNVLRNYQGKLQSMIREIQTNQSFYLKNRKRWEISLPVLESSLSEQIKDHIQSNLKDLNSVIDEYDQYTRRLVITENKITQDLILADKVSKEIRGLQEKRKAELFKRTDKNIFAENYRMAYSGSFFSRLKSGITDNTQGLGYFYMNLKSNSAKFLLFMIIFISVFYVIRNNYIKLNFDESKPGFFRINRILIQKPVLTLTGLILYFWTLYFPYSPLFISLIIYLAIVVTLFLTLHPVIDPFIKKIEFSVIILLILSNLQLFSWYFGNYSRIYMIIESLAGILLTYKYILPWYKVKKYKNQNPQLINITRIITLFIFIFYLTGFISNLTGFSNLAVYSLKLGVYTGVVSLMAHAIYRIISNIFLAGVHVLNIYYPEIFRKYGILIISKLNLYLKIALAYTWSIYILRAAELYESFSSKFINIFTNNIKIGSLNFTLGNLLFFVAVIYITYGIARFVKRIFEREILAKHKFKRGFAASISLTLRILIVFVGTLIAFSVSGMDLGKISLIAGALSVGIGFGLQNIVSNFISGLILVYEKPVMEGDTIEVNALLGRVSNIGIRSSTISTFDGADVVVPNSNLISNQLINWTLSDNRRRIELKVGTSYNSDPNVVLKLLLEAASSNDNVLRDPEPLSLFDGFGNSSLDFRLLFWVPFEVGLKTKSDVAVKVFNILKENDIEIPFPQLDLHVKEKPSASVDEMD